MDTQEVALRGTKIIIWTDSSHRLSIKLESRRRISSGVSYWKLQRLVEYVHTYAGHRDETRMERELSTRNGSGTE